MGQFEHSITYTRHHIEFFVHSGLSYYNSFVINKKLEISPKPPTTCNQQHAETFHDSNLNMYKINMVTNSTSFTIKLRSIYRTFSSEADREMSLSTNLVWKTTHLIYKNSGFITNFLLVDMINNLMQPNSIYEYLYASRL